MKRYFLIFTTMIAIATMLPAQNKTYYDCGGHKKLYIDLDIKKFRIYKQIDEYPNDLPNISAGNVIIHNDTTICIDTIRNQTITFIQYDDVSYQKFKLKVINKNDFIKFGSVVYATQIFDDKNHLLASLKWKNGEYYSSFFYSDREISIWYRKNGKSKTYYMFNGKLNPIELSKMKVTL